MSKIIISQNMIQDGPMMMATVLREVENICNEKGLDPIKIKEYILASPTIEDIQNKIDEFLGPDIIKIISDN
jgi:hypothetical protein